MLRQAETRQKYEEVITAEIMKSRLENLAIDQKFESINKIIWQALEKVIQLKDKIQKKWITEETLEHAKSEREAILRITDSTETAAKYNKLFNKVKASSRKDEQTWLEKQCTQIDKRTEERKIMEHETCFFGW